MSEQAEKGQVCVPQPKVGQVKEYGLSSFIAGQCVELTENLKTALPGSWNRVMAMAYCRLRNQSPLKYVQDDFADSYLSQTLGTEGLSARTLSVFLKELGKNREGILSFMRKYAGAGGNVLFDGTDMLSASAKMDFPRMNKTKLGGFADVVNIVMAFSTAQMLLVYYRLLPGKVKDITSFLTSVDEFGDPGMTVIGDKGFYSRKNVEELNKRNLRFIIAL